MTQVPGNQTQLDRIEAGVAELNKQVAQMQERQNSQGAKIEAHESYLTDHSQRIREVETKQAVSEVMGKQGHKRLMGRFSVLAAIGMLVLGALFSTVGKVLADLLTTGAQ